MDEKNFALHYAEGSLDRSADCVAGVAAVWDHLEAEQLLCLFYAASVLLSLLLTLRIINNKSNPAFKIAWLIPILLFPVLGGLVYLVFGSDRTGKYIRNKMGRIEKRDAGRYQQGKRAFGH